jgi:hypothetical protein
MDPNAFDTNFANFILNAVQVGGLIGFMTLSILAFVRGWVYSSAIVAELRQQIKDLTVALNTANTGMERMADAWEARNALERENREWDRRASVVERGASRQKDTG